MKPIDIRNVADNEILISWEDGHRSLYDYSFLRLNCPCATCRDEWTGERLVQLGQIPTNIHSSDIAPVGNYAIRFHWSDGHQTGIYGFDFLRRLCRCDSCQQKS